MFIGRKRELKTLERLYSSGHFEFVVLYGHRRIGKTTLINEFLKEKLAVYYMAVENNAATNLSLLSSTIMEALTDSSSETGLYFETMRHALEYVFSRAQRERLILAIDEYPFAARADKSLASTLQGLIDKYKDSSRLMLILCGSSISYMEDEVLSYKAPLYGRRTGQIRLGPLDFFDAQKFVPNLPAADRALAYGIAGGVPFYLQQISDAKSIATNIRDLFLDPSAMLFDEPRNLLFQELREPATYNAILQAIAEGAVRLNEISSKAGKPSASVSGYLNTLEELELIRKEFPYGEPNSKRSLYRVNDNLFRFWYRFVPRNLSAIMQGKADVVYGRIEPHLPHYMGAVFEDISKQYLWRQLGKDNIPVEFQDLGRWWGTDPRFKSQVEIDIIGIQDKQKALVAECKWTEEPVNKAVLQQLTGKTEILPYTDPYFVLFAKNGFSSSCRDLAQTEGNVSLLSLDTMIAEAEKEDR